MTRTSLAASALLLCLPVTGLAQSKKDKRSGYDRSARATVLHDAIVYVAPDDNGGKLAQVTPGHEVVVVSRSTAPGSTSSPTPTRPDDADPDANAEFVDDRAAHARLRLDPATKASSTPTTPTATSSSTAPPPTSKPRPASPTPPKGAAAAAHLLYRRVFEYFPDSPLAPEAAFRSADIRWQLDKLDISTLPQRQEQEAYLRPQLYEGEMKRVMKLYPDTQFAACAAFDLLDNKLCGDWQGLPKCPEMETNLYLKYADQYPDGPKSAEALYNAAYRQGVLVTMYTVDDNRKRSDGRRQTLPDHRRPAATAHSPTPTTPPAPPASPSASGRASPSTARDRD